MTNTTPASGAAIQRYKIGYHPDEWASRSRTPSGIPDASGSWVRYADHLAALAAGQATAAQQGAAYAELPDEREMLKHALWLASSFTVHRYMMSCAEGRWSGAEKATCHDKLCCLYVAVFRGAEVDRVRVDFEADWVAVHDATQELTDHMDVVIGFPLKGVPDYEALAPKFFAYFHRLATHALRASRGQAPAGAGEAAEHYRNAIARARLLDSDLSNLTERGAKAWTGVDAQALRDGGASPSANAGGPSGHIKEPYTLAEIKAKIASNDYSAEMLLQHAMLLLDSVQEEAARYRWLREGNDAKHGAAWHVAVNLYGCEWDAAIDAARKRGEKP